MEKISLNGLWQADYLTPVPAEGHIEQKYRRDLVIPFQGDTEPELTESRVTCPVPGYWEDLTDRFRATPLHAKLRWNPLYTLQRYPQAGYVPDMALPNVVGSFLYQREVSLEKADGPAFLWLGGVQNTASAWINGTYLGRHEGYSSDFSFPIPAGLLRPGKNRVSLVISNVRLQGYQDRPVSGLTSRAANECTGGIYGDVELRFCPDGLEDAWVTTAEDLASFTLHLTGGTEVDKEISLFDGKKLLARKILPAGESTAVFPTQGWQFWSPDTPKLYRAVITTPHQQIERRFGLRRLTVQGNRLFLNGAPYFFRGICEHCYFPLTVHPTRDKNYYRKNLRILKELGFNSIRFHTHVPMAEYMEAADELGLLMEIETPNNTSYAEWKDIVRMTRRYTAPAAYSSGNEMTIDEEYVAHLKACADLVHTETDSLFSPMSALRSIEYAFKPWDETVEEPFLYSPKRLAQVAEFSDLYNTYSLGLTSYGSDQGDPALLDRRNAVYGKPLLSHEICINGTYKDLSLEERYQGSRIGETELFSSVRRHLQEKGLLSRAPLYYRNSVAWQSLLRKYCFETTRRAESFAGYDFLGDIDTHWHTFGYCVGMMNEFYEMKPGETVQNVRRYNSAAVLLADLPRCRNFTAGESIEVPILLSNYREDLEKATLTLRISDGSKVYLRKTLHCGQIKNGAITQLTRLQFTFPREKSPRRLLLTATLSGGNVDAENEWELYSFPKTKPAAPPKSLLVAETMTADALLANLEAGKTVLLLSAGPFPTEEVSFQMALAGRTTGHLATVITDHPAVEGLPHAGFCGWQFREMMTDAQAVVIDHPGVPYAPIIEIATSYKNARPEALLMEYRVGKGKLLVSTFRLPENDPAAAWWKAQLISYAAGEDFVPKTALPADTLRAWLNADRLQIDGNDTNQAANVNDITHLF